MSAIGGACVDDLVGTVVPLTKDRVTTVGRAGDLAFRGNPYLNRHVVGVMWNHGRWWLQSVGAWTSVRYGTTANPLASVLVRGEPVILAGGDTHVVFAAGQTEYEVAIRIPPVESPTLTLPRMHEGAETIGPRALTLEQLQMLVAFAEPILVRTCVGISEVATMRDVEDRLSWSTAKLRRKLDYLCQKLSEAGIAGLVSESGAPASHRRLRLIEWALSTGVIDRDGLRLLDLDMP